MNGTERAADDSSHAPFTGTPLEALGGLAGGIIVNYTELVKGLTSPDVDVRFLMEEYGYALAADTLTAYRLSKIPHVMAIFLKPPGERSWKDARLVAKAWASDRFDGDFADMANQRSPYGGPADKLADKALWAGPSALQVMNDEMHPLVFSSIFMRDLLLERQRNQAARNGDSAAHTAISVGKYKTTLQGVTQTFSASPAAARHPQVREGLQWATAAASIGSGILTAAEIEKASLGAKYAGRGRLAGIRLGITALSRQGI
jgi:phosphatidylglycerophosphate synthase